MRERREKGTMIFRHTVACFVDSARPEMVLELQQRGMIACGADKSVLAGISKVVQLSPTISSACPKLLMERLCYHWNANKRDEPVKENDHGPDSLRYSIMGHEDAYVEEHPYTVHAPQIMGQFDLSYAVGA